MAARVSAIDATKMTRVLADGYSVEVDSVSVTDWYRHVSAFSDASIYQLWQPAPRQEGFQGTSRLLVGHRGDVVAAAEARLFTVPFTRRGIAYIRWGPLWKRSGERENFQVLRQALRALHHEYVLRRRMVLRIMPRLSLEDSPYFPGLAIEEGFSPLGYLTPERTLLMRLSGDLDDLRKGLAPTWRRLLNKAERAGLTVTVGTTLELFDEFIIVYNEMLKRKHFAPWADIDKHRRIQTALPDDLKMRVLLARKDGYLCAGLIYSAIGDVAIYLFGATNEIGMQTSASYLLHWEAVKLLKAAGLTEYDLNGINPALNPGIYQFKKGLAGKNGRECTFLGQVQGFQGSVTNHLLLLADRMRHRARTSRVAGGARHSSAAIAAKADASATSER